MTIWKYVVEVCDEGSEHYIPEGAQILSVMAQPKKHALGNSVCFWALVDPEQPPVRRTFRVIGTGWTFDATGYTYIGSAQTGPYVWHVFEVTQ